MNQSAHCPSSTVKQDGPNNVPAGLPLEAVRGRGQATVALMSSTHAGAGTKG